MEKRELGQTGILMSPLGLGTVKFGRNAQVKYPEDFDIPEERDLASLLSLAKDLGVNTLDTAPSYGMSEDRLGRLLKGQRQDWVVIGKAGEAFDGVSRYDFSAPGIQESVQNSLRRLQTDYLDILLIHSDGSDVELLQDDALLKVLEDFKKSGRVRAVGVSTKTVDGGLKSVECLDTVMVSYNPAWQAEKPVLDHAAKTGKGVILKKALSSGHIDHVGGVESALRFVFEAPAVRSVVIGTINPDHLKDNVDAARRALMAPVVPE